MCPPTTQSVISFIVLNEFDLSPGPMTKLDQRIHCINQLVQKNFENYKIFIFTKTSEATAKNGNFCEHLESVRIGQFSQYLTIKLV